MKGVRMKIEIKILNKEFYECVDLENCKTFNLPYYATGGSAALDLMCTEDIDIYPGVVIPIYTGLAIHISSGVSSGFYEKYSTAGLIMPRSGLGTKGLVLANTIGVIDGDYQGELIVQAWNRNLDYSDFQIIKLKAGDRFAQLMFVPVSRIEWELVEEFSNTTNRSIKGFGSTGK